MYANLILKQKLIQFWSSFGDRRKHGFGHAKQVKVAALKAMALEVIPFHKQQSVVQRRDKFNVAKRKLHPFRRFGVCFCCGYRATARHHIIQLQNGGINSRMNLVSLCDSCHTEIHPWLATA